MDNPLFITEPFLTGKPLEVWLASMGVRSWSINDGLVAVKGDVDLYGKLGELKRLPIRFGKVSGFFACDNNQLVSLEGAPKEVGGNFLCNYTRLVSLEGAPKKVGGNFYCNNNLVVSLEGAPKEVGRNFHCHHNQLVSLDGAPKKVGGDFNCDYNQLVSLEGSPEQVGGGFYCYKNQLVSLAGAPKNVGGDFWCDHNLLVDLKGLEGVSIAGNLIVTDLSKAGQDNVFVSLEGLPKELYWKINGLDIHGVVGGFDVQALSAVQSQHSGIPDIEI